MAIEYNQYELCKSAIRDIFFQMPTRTVMLSNWDGYKNHLIGYYGELNYKNAMKELIRDGFLKKNSLFYEWKSYYTRLRDMVNEGINSRDAKYRSSDAIGCLMLSFKNPLWEKRVLYEFIPQEDHYNLFTAANKFGYEHEPHVTVLYGFKPTTDLNKLYWYMRKNWKKNYKVVVETPSLFENAEFDVLKFDVDIPELITINAELKNMFDTYPSQYTYKPHMTIAYLKKGMGKHYLKKIKPLELTTRTFIYTEDIGPDEKKLITI